MENLQTFRLLGTNFKTNNKKLNQDVMLWVGQKDIITEENFGSRNDHHAIELVLEERLALEILHYKKEAIILSSSDAKGCFGGIVHSVAYICLLRWGLPKATVLSILRYIMELTHHILAAFSGSQQ